MVRCDSAGRLRTRRGSAVFEVTLDFAGRRGAIARGCRKTRWKRLPEGWYVAVFWQHRTGSWPTRITPSDVGTAAAMVRAHQFRNARGGEQVEYHRMRPDVIDVSSLPGTPRAARLTIRDNGSDTSKTAFKTNMRKLARALAWNLGQRVVLLSIGTSAEDARTARRSGERGRRERTT